MIVRIHESSHINRWLLQDSDVMCMKAFRRLLRSEGLDVTRKLSLDLSTPGLLVVTYDSSPHSVYAFPFCFVPLSDEDKYKHNLRERKKGKDGKYIKANPNKQPSFKDTFLA